LELGNFDLNQRCLRRIDCALSRGSGKDLRRRAQVQHAPRRRARSANATSPAVLAGLATTTA
jgi:hypothetical protein